MTDAERDRLHEMNGRLGALEGEVKHFRQTWEHQDEKAGTRQARLYDKFEELIRGMAGLTFRVDQLAKELSELKPSVASLTGTHRENIGSKKMLAFVWTIILAGVSAVSWSAVEVVKLILGKH